jgi:hypothetical protein
VFDAPSSTFHHQGYSNTTFLMSALQTLSSRVVAAPVSLINHEAQHTRQAAIVARESVSKAGLFLGGREGRQVRADGRVRPATKALEAADKWIKRRLLHPSVPLTMTCEDLFETFVRSCPLMEFKQQSEHRGMFGLWCALNAVQ